MTEDAKDKGQDDEPNDDDTEAVPPNYEPHNSSSMWDLDAEMFRSIYDCDVDALRAPDFSRPIEDRIYNDYSNPGLFILIESGLLNGSITKNDIQVAQDLLGTIADAMAWQDPHVLRALRSAHKGLLDARTDMMEKRADVVLEISRAVRHFPLNITPPIVRCPNCSDVYTSESTCSDCGAAINLPDPKVYFEQSRHHSARGLARCLAQSAREFNDLPVDFIIEYLSSGKEPITIAAYFSSKVGAFGDRGKVWRDVAPVANRYRGACATESAQARFAKWREACATVDAGFGPVKSST